MFSNGFTSQGCQKWAETQSPQVKSPMDSGLSKVGRDTKPTGEKPRGQNTGLYGNHSQVFPDF